ncbi:MAG: hypothetical protein HY735_05810 [Verrucomicrobia bacterium]|nr:hypothetical protein [Verrucomicrobiota bacterium]
MQMRRILEAWFKGGAGILLASESNANSPKGFRLDARPTLVNRVLKRSVWLSLAVLAFSSLAGISPDGQGIQKRFDAARPPAQQLRVYQLDWASNLQAARTRAAKELRPILFLVVLNSYGDLFTGHC